MSKISLFAAIVLLILPFVLIAIFWADIPDTIPIHYNLQGEADRYASKAAGIFILPGVSVFTFLLMYFLPQIDPKKRVTLQHQGYTTLVLIFVAFFFVLFVLELSNFLGHQLPVNHFLIIMPLLFLLLGNYITKVQPNYFVGIRTPWTLEDETVWLKTHRFGGRLWVVSSLIMLVLALVFNNSMPEWVMLVYISFIALVPLIYSYMVSKKGK